MTPIEALQVGQRVRADAPTDDVDRQFGDEVVPSEWQKLTLTAPKRDGTVADVVLLRPRWWIAQHQAEVDGQVFISVPECGINGNATVHSVDACPEIVSGPGRVITGTFRHRVSSGIALSVEGEEQPIRCTGNHPFWSEDRQGFVRADSLQPDERLRTPNGVTKVLSSIPLAAETPVYNLEVHGEHVYHVGAWGALVHNGGGSLQILGGSCAAAAQQTAEIIKAANRHGVDFDAGQRVTVIGRMHDVNKFTENSMVDSWAKSAPSGPFRVRKNREWIMERVKRGDAFVLASDRKGLSSVPVEGVGNGYYTFLELKWLEKAGVEVTELIR